MPVESSFYASCSIAGLRKSYALGVSKLPTLSGDCRDRCEARLALMAAELASRSNLVPALVMDPHANLAEQLELARTILADEDDRSGYRRDIDAARLAELAIALHDWIVASGFLPATWRGR